MADLKEAKTFKFQMASGGGPNSSIVTRVSASSGDYSSKDEYFIPTLQADDGHHSGRTVQL
jgi:hypothetical protein